VNEVKSIISQLERQKSAIDRAIGALREVTGAGLVQPTVTGAPQKRARKKRRLSPEGRQRIIDAAKRRWAMKKAGQASGAKQAKKATKKKGARKKGGRRKATVSAAAMAPLV
jgi:hypothetical protein